MSVQTAIGAAPAAAQPLDSSFAHLERAGLPSAGRTVVARAPLPLDVMGGVADATGALALCWPLHESVVVAVQPRDDCRISLARLSSECESAGEPALWPVGFFADNAEPCATPAAPVSGSLAERAIHALLRVLVQLGGAAHFGGGVSIYIDGAADDNHLESSISVQAAALLALSRFFERSIEAQEAVAICQQAQRIVPGIPLGPAAPWTVLTGEAGVPLQVRAPAGPSASALCLPPGITVLGIMSGSRHREAARKCCDAHVAAAMGRRIVQTLLAGAADGTVWTGQLGNLTVSEYVTKLRDKLPTQMRGKAFSQRFGELPECGAALAPESFYKIRSRTEHHVYENARAHQFIDRLARTTRTGERGALLDAGELMYASHWSCGQRCGLGDLATERLVNALRRRGPADGIWGARTSGCGSGGVVSVLLSDTPAARQTIAEVVNAYEAHTGFRTHLLSGSSDGALLHGADEF
ncbi:MAG TPA: hypothetical protein VGM03_13255 [Phycisphaerae bacterium]|jgi:L-arabinokinase